MSKAPLCALAVLFATSCSSAPTTSTNQAAAGADAGKITADSAIEYMDIDEGQFTVNPGEEATWCVRIPIPDKFKGRKLGLMGWISDLPVPTHHFFISYSQKPVTGTANVPCNGVDGKVPQSNLIGEMDPSVGTAKMLFGAGTGHHEILSTQDYGRLLETTGSLVTNHHVLNTGTTPVTMTGKFRLQVKDWSTVSHPMSQMTCSAPSISIPSGGSSQTTGTCIAPFDMDLIIMASHAHARLTKAEQRFYDGKTTQPEVIYTSTEWDSPKLQLMDTAPVHLKKGQGVTFTCYYTNTTDHEIHLGLSATDEMCVLFDGYAYPATRTFQSPPSLYTGSASDTAPSMAVDSSKSTFFF